MFLTVLTCEALASAMHWATATSIPIALLLAAFALGAHGSLRIAEVGVLATVGVGGALALVRAPYFDSWLAAFNVGQVCAACFLGAAVRRKRWLAERARSRRAALFARGAQDAERAVLVERLRVARVLHARVCTSLDDLTMRAAKARAAGDDHHDVLREIERSGRAITADLRQMLGTLRDAEPVVDRESRHRWNFPRMPSGPAAVDVAVACAVLVLNVGGTLLVHPQVPAGTYVEPVWPALVALSFVPGLAMLVRRTHPVVTFVVTLSVIAVVGLLHWPEGNLPASALIASFAVGAWAGPARGLLAIAALWCLPVIASVLGPGIVDIDAAEVAVFTAPWFLGAVLRMRRVRDERDIELCHREEQAHAARIHRTLVDERLAVARDLHDVVGHTLAGVVIQATAARLAADVASADVLRRIEVSGRDALVELQAMVGALSVEPRLAPAARASDVATVVERHAKVWGGVDVAIDPAIGALPESVQLTVVRIVQEALTNLAKHARGAPATVQVASTGDEIRIVVANASPPPARAPAGPPWSGLGLIGMRERVELLSGDFVAGPTSSGGFRVEAVLPVTPMQQASPMVAT